MFASLSNLFDVFKSSPTSELILKTKPESLSLNQWLETDGSARSKRYHAQDNDTMFVPLIAISGIFRKSTEFFKDSTKNCSFKEGMALIDIHKIVYQYIDIMNDLKEGRGHCLITYLLNFHETYQKISHDKEKDNLQCHFNEQVKGMLAWAKEKKEKASLLAGDSTKVIKNRTPLIFASFNGYTPIVKTLYQAYLSDRKAWSILLQPTEKGITFFLAAAQNGHMDIVKLAVDTAVKDSSLASIVLKPRENGMTGFCAASYHGHLNAVQYILTTAKNHPSLQQVLLQPMNSGHSALCLAAQSGKANIVNYIIEQAIKNPHLSHQLLSTQCRDGTTSGFIAAAKGHTDILKSMLEATVRHPSFGHQLLSKRNDGVTILQAATTMKKTSIVNLIHQYSDKQAIRTLL